MIAASVLSCAVFGGIMAAFSGVFPLLYNTTDSVRAIATQLICINAIIMPFNAFTHAAYFTIRSGGKTLLTFLFDSGYMWAFSVPLTFCLSRFTDIPIVPLFFICSMTDLVKCAIGVWMLKRGTWIKNLTKN